MDRQGRPLNLGLQINHLRVRYPQLIINCARDWARRNGHNLWVFSGSDYRPVGEINNSSNSVYEHMNGSVIDGLIMASGSLFSRVNPDSMAEGTLPCHWLPTVALGRPLRGIPSVQLDNSIGVYKLVSHLIEDHGYRKIGFIGGSPGSSDSQERMEAWKQCMKDHGLFPDFGLTAQGDFTLPSGAAGIRAILSSGGIPDAVVCATDEMAIGMMQECRGLRIRIPFIGFDNVSEAGDNGYNITTVNQNYASQVETAFRLLLNLLDGKSVPLVSRIEPDVIIRGSCGCINHVIGERGDFEETQAYRLKTTLSKTFEGRADEDWHERMIDVIHDLLMTERGVSFNSWSCALEATAQEVLSVCGKDQEQHPLVVQVFREAVSIFLQSVMATKTTRSMNSEAENTKLREASRWVSTAHSLEELLGNLDYWLSEFGVHDCQVVLYDTPFQWSDFENGEFPLPKARVIFDTRVRDYSLKGIEMSPRELLPRQLISKDGKGRIVLPLSHGKRVFGYLVIAMTEGDDQYIVLDTLALQTASGLNSIEMIERLREASRQDELTGLLNRRGFLEMAQQDYNLSVRNGWPGVFIFADLDRMKSINDTYGHCEGDEALRTIASLLRSSIRETDILGRIGGDEFVILSVNAGIYEVRKIIERINGALTLFNSTTSKPWKLGLSIGFTEYGSGSGKESFESILNAADKELYIMKKAVHSGF